MLNIWRLGQIRDTKFGTNVSNKMVINAEKYQVKAFSVPELLREKQQLVKLPHFPPPTTQIKIKFL